MERMVVHEMVSIWIHCWISESLVFKSKLWFWNLTVSGLLLTANSPAEIASNPFSSRQSVGMFFELCQWLQVVLGSYWLRKCVVGCVRCAASSLWRCTNSPSLRTCLGSSWSSTPLTPPGTSCTANGLHLHVWFGRLKGSCTEEASQALSIGMDYPKYTCSSFLLSFLSC